MAWKKGGQRKLLPFCFPQGGQAPPLFCPFLRLSCKFFDPLELLGVAVHACTSPFDRSDEQRWDGFPPTSSDFAEKSITLQQARNYKRLIYKNKIVKPTFNHRRQTDIFFDLHGVCFMLCKLQITRAGRSQSFDAAAHL